MATHTLTVIPPAMNDGSGVALTAGGAAGGGASMVLVIDDAVCLSKEQAVLELEQIVARLFAEVWPPSI